MTWILPRTVPGFDPMPAPSLTASPVVIRLPPTQDPKRRAIEAFALAAAAIDQLPADERQRVIRALAILYPEGIK